VGSFASAVSVKHVTRRVCISTCGPRSPGDLLFKRRQAEALSFQRNHYGGVGQASSSVDGKALALRSIFLGTGAFLGRIDSETRCAFWADDPVDHDFDQTKLIEIDFGRTPSAAAAKEIGWDEVQVDDCFTAPNGVVSGSTLGPRWPELHLAGAVYLEVGFVESLPSASRPSCPPAGMRGHGYEYMTCVYWPDLDDPRAGRRYSGHHAEILEERGQLARVAVYAPGGSDRPAAQPVTMWIDLSSVEQCDAGPDSLTKVGVGPAAKSGALFLTNGQVLTNQQTSEASS
jgi:hypothetical protein